MLAIEVYRLLLTQLQTRISCINNQQWKSSSNCWSGISHTITVTALFNRFLKTLFCYIRRQGKHLAVYQLQFNNVQFQKMSIICHRRDWNFLRVWWGFLQGSKFKELMKLNWNFQRGGGTWKKIPLVGEV